MSVQMASSGSDAKSLLAGQLRAVLDELAECYAALDVLADEHHGAIKRADARGLSVVIARQNEVVQRVAAVERTRAKLVEALGSLIGVEAGTQATAERIAASLEDRLARPLLDSRERLRGLLDSVVRKQRVIEQAAGLLAAHMEGLLRRMRQELNHARTYSARGRVDAGPQIISGLDIAS